jgi:hypothetical protein
MKHVKESEHRYNINLPLLHSTLTRGWDFNTDVADDEGINKDDDDDGDNAAAAAGAAAADDDDDGDAEEEDEDDNANGAADTTGVGTLTLTWLVFTKISKQSNDITGANEQFNR